MDIVYLNNNLHINILTWTFPTTYTLKFEIINQCASKSASSQLEYILNIKKLPCCKSKSTNISKLGENFIHGLFYPKTSTTLQKGSFRVDYIKPSFNHTCNVHPQQCWHGRTLIQQASFNLPFKDHPQSSIVFNQI